MSAVICLIRNKSFIFYLLDFLRDKSEYDHVILNILKTFVIFNNQAGFMSSSSFMVTFELSFAIEAQENQQWLKSTDAAATSRLSTAALF